ncbi:MAG: hypothetical protein WA125_11385 [Desulfosporosinus sp.]
MDGVLTKYIANQIQIYDGCSDCSQTRPHMTGRAFYRAVVGAV